MNALDRDATAILGSLARQDREVGAVMEARSFRTGETVPGANDLDMAASLCLVIKGRLQLFRTTRMGRFPVAKLGPGSMFGEESLLGGAQPGTFAVALEESTLWFLPPDTAREISSTNAMFGFGLMQAMGQRLAETENQLEQMAFSTIASRLAALLLELGDDDPHGVVRVSHNELAEMLGTWRETVSKTLRDFRRRGWVSSHRRRLTLLDRQSLREASIAF